MLINMLRVNRLMVLCCSDCLAVSSVVSTEEAVPYLGF